MSKPDRSPTDATRAIVLALLLTASVVSVPVAIAQNETDSGTATGDVVVTAEQPHPEINTVQLLSTDGTDRTEQGVVVPGETHSLEIELTAAERLSALDRLNITLYRGSEIGDVPENGTEWESFELSATFDDTGAGTITTAGDGGMLDASVGSIDPNATTDTVSITLTPPTETRPSANSDTQQINDQTWVVDTAAMNEDILDQSDPETHEETFDVSVMLDVELQATEIQLSGGALPGSDNVPLSAGSEQAITVRATGNTDMELAMDFDHLEHQRSGSDYTIGANNVAMLVGDGYSADDYNHSNVQQLGPGPVALSENGNSLTLTPGETTELRLWVDLPEDTRPGEYRGQFTIVASEASE